MGKTYRFDAVYYYSDGGEVTIDDDEDITIVIEQLAYVVSRDGGLSMPWDDVSIDFELVDEDEE